MKAHMPIETTSAAGAAAAKIIGIPVLAGAAATALTFCFMWPNSRREAFVRFTSSILCSIILGPVCIAALHSWWPELFASARAIAAMEGLDPALGMLVVAGPVMMLAGLPAWWLLGGIVLWLERRRGKDIAEIAQDAAGAVKDVRGAL